MGIKDILEENERRKSLIFGYETESAFNPVSGHNSIGERFEIKVGDRKLWLPVGMRDIAIVRRIKTGEYDGGIERELDRVRLRYDFAYWCATRAYIKRKGGGEDILFQLNRPQRKLVTVLEEMRRREMPIRLILLKARQWGGSTCVQLYMAWLQLIHKTGLNSLLIAHQGAGTDEIKDMFDRMIAGIAENRPEEGLTVENVGKSRSIFRVRERNCKIKVGSAERPDSCRGGDYSLVHCSEVGIWKSTAGKSPEAMIRSACSGVLLEPMTMIVYESTANGTGNFFHREYEAASRGESQFRALFVAWYEIDQYSLPLSNPEEFAGELWTNREVENSTSDRRESGKYLWWLWERGATLEAINWYIGERMKYGDHGQMASEYPSDDIEAFVHSGARVFDRYKVEELREGCRKLPVLGEIDIDGGGVPFNPAKALEDEKRDALERVVFRPMRSGGWQVWGMPERSGEGRYVVCVDVGGRSLKADWSVIVVFDRKPMISGQGPEVVAQWRGHTDFDLLAWRAAMVAKFYSNALLVIESNTLETHEQQRGLDGDQSETLLNRIRNVYDNLYARPQSNEAVMQGQTMRYGFHTNAATKPMVISTLVQVVREGLYTERDPMCLDEYLVYERRPNGSFGAIPGCHDDLLMTRAIGLHICFHEMGFPERGDFEPDEADGASGYYSRRRSRSATGYTF